MTSPAATDFRVLTYTRGSRFQYTVYRTDRKAPIQKLSSTARPPVEPPIHQSIEELDREGMEAIETGSHDAFAEYLSRTKNTICGRHPIGVVMAGLENLLSKGDGRGKFKFVRYEQSSHVKQPRDSSVSYASAFART